MFQDGLLDQINTFLKKRAPFSGPLILGYSGGFDSKALLYLLLQVQKQVQNQKQEPFKFELVLAHVDHSWREESAQEAQALKKEAKKLGLRFFLKTLSLDKFSNKSLDKNQVKNSTKTLVKNQEALARNLRLEFFQKLYRKLGASGLLLAHQKDDQIETVLKRFLEGADLPFLKGMQEESSLMGMQVLRPLLPFSKKELVSFLNANQLKALEDRTNFDPKYLRSRMRSSILPQLGQQFGKEILENLALTASRSKELQDYLERKIEKPFLKRQLSPFGLMLDLKAADFTALEQLEQRYLIKKLALKASFNLSRSTMEQVLAWISNQSQKPKPLLLTLKEGELNLENEKLFFWKKNQKMAFMLNRKIALKKGTLRFDQWQLKISEVKAKKASLSSWKELFSGSAEIILPKDDYYLVPYQDDLRLFKKRLSRHMAEQKVPFFLRKRFPLIFRKKELFCDLLSGRPRFPQKPSQADQVYYKINFKN